MECVSIRLKQIASRLMHEITTYKDTLLPPPKDAQKWLQNATCFDESAQGRKDERRSQKSIRGAAIQVIPKRRSKDTVSRR